MNNNSSTCEFCGATCGVKHDFYFRDRTPSPDQLPMGLDDPGCDVTFPGFACCEPCNKAHRDKPFSQLVELALVHAVATALTS